MRGSRHECQQLTEPLSYSRAAEVSMAIGGTDKGRMAADPYDLGLVKMKISRSRGAVRRCQVWAKRPRLAGAAADGLWEEAQSGALLATLRSQAGEVEVAVG